VIAAPHIEPATPADIEALARLRVEMGWLRSDPLLHGVLAWEGGRVFIVRARSLGVTADGIADLPVASAGAIVAGPVGVIGNVTVRPEFQRRGLGGLLTAHAIAWQRAQGARAVWLDATPAGRPLYRRLGFEDVAVSWDAHAPLRDLRLERLASLAGSISAAKAPAEALASVAALDLTAFGGDRTGLLRALLAQQDRYALYIAHDAHDAHDATRRPLGFALTRRLEQPWQGTRLGPLIAPDDRVAAALTLAAARTERRRLPAEFAQGSAYITVGCGDAPDIRAYFDSIGLPTEDDDLVMRLTLADDEDDPPPAQQEGQPHVYSWTAPMVF
jgi:GNAT superfamily N-acetyltransferase